LPFDVRKGFAFPTPCPVHREAAPRNWGVAPGILNSRTERRSLSAHQAAEPQICQLALLPKNLTSLISNNLQVQFSQLFFVDFTGRVDHQVLS
jgi:hypothetical protein